MVIKLKVRDFKLLKKIIFILFICSGMYSQQFGSYPSATSLNSTDLFLIRQGTTTTYTRKLTYFLLKNSIADTTRNWNWTGKHRFLNEMVLPPNSSQDYEGEIYFNLGKVKYWDGDYIRTLMDKRDSLTLFVTKQSADTIRGVKTFSDSIRFSSTGLFIAPTNDTLTVGSIYRQGNYLFFRRDSTHLDTLNIGGAGGSVDTAKAYIWANTHRWDSTATFTDFTDMSAANLLLPTDSVYTMAQVGYLFYNSFRDKIGYSASGGVETYLSNVGHTHSTSDLTSGVLGISRGGTNTNWFTDGKFVKYNGTKLISTTYDSTSFEPTLTKGNLTESVTGLQFDVTRQVIGGAVTLSLTSGYVIPTTTQETNWNTAYTNNHTHSNKAKLDSITVSAYRLNTLATFGVEANNGYTYTPLTIGATTKNYITAVNALPASVITSGTLGIARGGTNSSSLTSSQFLWFNGTSIVASGYSNSSFANASHYHSGNDITSGTVADARLSSNIPLKDAANIWTGYGLSADRIFHKVSGTTSTAGVTLTGFRSELSTTSNPTAAALYGGYFIALGSGTSGGSSAYGIYAEASGANTNWAGYFNGNVYMSSLGTSGTYIPNGYLTSLTVTNTITGSVSGNASTVTNGVYTNTTQTITGTKTFSQQYTYFGASSSTPGEVVLYNDVDGATSTRLKTSGDSNGNREITFPDATGTVALTSDLSSYVTKTGNETISGNKTHTGAIYFDNELEKIFAFESSDSTFSIAGRNTFIVFNADSVDYTVFQVTFSNMTDGQMVMVINDKDSKAGISFVDVINKDDVTAPYYLTLTKGESAVIRYRSSESKWYATGY